MSTTDLTRREIRLLRFLSRGDAKLRVSASEGSVLVDGGDRGTLGETAETVAELERSGLVTRSLDLIRLSEAGRDALAVAREAIDALQTQKPEHASKGLATEAGIATIVVNEAESPLASLWRRRNREGGRFLSASEFRAGERLRADFSRGHLMPRLGVDWSSFGGSAGQGGGRGDGLAELTEAALSARMRVERAINAVGPELSGVLIDVCCFLKGLERVEAERGWPVRSAKVVLKTALGALARHYEPVGTGRREACPILHWGAPDYRPSFG